MAWFRWKLWRIAWAYKSGFSRPVWITDSDGEWRSLFGTRLMLLRKAA